MSLDVNRLLLVLAILIAGHSYIGHVELEDCEETEFKHCEL